MSAFTGLNSVYAQLAPYTFVMESDQQPDYQWKRIEMDPSGPKLEVNDIALIQEPSETLDLKVECHLYSDHKKGKLYELHFELKFHNNLHFFVQDYDYEFSCEKAGNGKKLPDPLFKVYEQRLGSTVKNTKQILISKSDLLSKDLRFSIRRCDPKEKKLVANLRSLLEVFPTDVILKVEQSILPAHKVVLSSKSAEFRDMFANDTVEKRTGIVNIKGFRTETIEEMLNFMYEGRVKNPETCSTLLSIYNLFKAADKYELYDLRHYCEEWILFQSKLENVVETLTLAHLYENSYLKKCMWNFIKQHEDKMVIQPKFLGFLSQMMSRSNAVKTLLFASKHKLETVEHAALNYIAKNYLRMNVDVDFLQLFAERPTLMKKIYLFYTETRGSKLDLRCNEI